jgi:5-methylcytosine-specific restriction enzyme subunit McrC
LIEIEPVRAWGEEERELPADVAAALAATGVAKVVPVGSPTRWRIEADSRIGVVVGDGWELRIRPKLAIPKLLFLLAYSLQPKGWRDAVTGMREERDVVDALASGFAFHAERAINQGLLRGYIAVEERRNDLRGRIRFGDQLARLPGLPLPLEVSYDDFTADIPENRLLRTAIERLLMLPRIAPQARARLLRLRAVLQEVNLLPDRRRVDLPTITRLNKRYEAALVLGKLVLDGTSLRQDRGPVATTSFLFDMNEVFESFLSTALREALERRAGGRVQLQYNRNYLDDGRILRLKPDITWWHGGRCRAVIDAKYKALKDARFPNADAYQILAYCIGFGVQRGFLVYARDSLDRSRLHEIQRHRYEIEVLALDVEQKPEELLQQVDDIAEKIASFVPDDPTAGMAVA